MKKIIYHSCLCVLSSLSLLGHFRVSAQTWGGEQLLSEWWEDPATPGNGVHASTNNNPFYTSALVTAMPSVLSGGSGATYSALVSPGESYTYHQLQGVDACSAAAAQSNNEYFTATATISPSVRTLRISSLVYSTFQGDGILATTYQVSFAARDVTTNGPLVFAMTGLDALYTPSAGSNNVYRVNSSTAGWNFITLLPGHTYEFRWYINKLPSDCGGSSFKRMDNPEIDVQMVDAVTISGTVFNDIDGAANGVGNLSGAQVSGLNAVLVDANGNAAAVTAVNSSNGTYSFPGVDPVNSTFKVMLTTTTPVVGQPASATATLPAGWLSTGENIGTGTGNDGTANAISASFSPTGNTTVNFGINQPPVANNDAITGQPPGSPATIPNLLSNDTDPSGGTLSPANISLVAPPWAVNPVTDAQGDVTSFSVAWQGTWMLNPNGSVTFSPDPGFLGDPTPISYTVTDAAGGVSNSATLSIDFNAPVPVSGTVYNDNNGPTGGPGGTVMAGITVTLYAANGTTVMATTNTAANGNYSFPNQVPGNYVVGITLPSGYQNVSSTDATPSDGKTAVTVGSVAISGVNFGLNQPPVAANDTLNNQVPGSPATIPNLLSNDTDSNSGTLSPDSINLIPPAGATSIITDAQGDTTGFTVPGQGIWALNSSTGAVTFTPQSGFMSDPAPVSYTVTDNAGLTSNTATLTIDYIPVPDLTPVITLPVNQFANGESRNFVVTLNELLHVATSGQVVINLAVPSGYTLSFDNAATNINVLPTGNVAISNVHWNAFVNSATSINLQAQNGFVISGNANTVIGFTLTRTTALAGSQGNITVSIFADAAHSYDSVPGNNFYSRIITAN